jgi:hypothetical protein
MTASADLLEQLTIDDYARLAFSIEPLDPSDPNSTGFGAGGVYAGPLENAPDAKPWHASYRNRMDRDVTARARLVQVPPGKLFVRWARGATLGDWKAAAGGVWWVTDNMADRIVRDTVRRFGKLGNSGLVAREYSQVAKAWSDMGSVVVCRTTRPIKVLLGIGRPVHGILVHSPHLKDALQVVILTRIDSPKNSFEKDAVRRSRFIGDQFFQKVEHLSSVQFTAWWLIQGFVEDRRAAMRRR